MVTLIGGSLLFLFAAFVYWIGYSDGKLRQREKNLARSLRIVGRRLTDD